MAREQSSRADVNDEQDFAYWAAGAAIARSTPPWFPHSAVVTVQAPSRHITVCRAGPAPIAVVVEPEGFIAQPEAIAARMRAGMERDGILMLTSSELKRHAVKTASDPRIEWPVSYIGVGRE